MPDNKQSILIGGVAGGVIGTLIGLIPIVESCLACMVYLGTGLLAVWHYTNAYNLTIPSSEGVRVGALAGLVGFLVNALIGLAYWVAMGMPSVSDFMRQRMEGQPNVDPAQIEDILQFMDSPFVLIAIALVSLLVWVVMGLAGGAIGAGVFKKGDAGPASF